MNYLNKYGKMATEASKKKIRIKIKADQRYKRARKMNVKLSRKKIKKKENIE